MAKGKGKKVNRTELAAIFGVTAPTVDGWIRAGCPYDQRAAGKGKEWVFDSGDVAMWLQQRAREEATGDDVTDERELKRRKLAAETSLVELELAKAKNLVAPVDQMERAVSRVLAEVCSNMRNLPGNVVSLLIGETDERKFKKVLLREIDVVLESLSSLDVTADEPADEDEGADGDA